MTEQFFDERKPQAVLKHRILGAYAAYFIGRAGKRTGGKVHVVDGYAGAGRYDDGSPGSPLLLAESIEAARKIGRDGRLSLVEKDAGTIVRLRESLAETEVEAEIFEGELSRHLLALSKKSAGDATLYFVDPFSYGLAFEELVGLLNGSVPIDVIYHFSITTFGRVAPAVVRVGPDSGRVGNAEHDLNAALGPVEWMMQFGARMARGEKAYRIAGDVCHQFAEAVTKRTGRRATIIEVKPRRNVETIYTLVLFSRDAEAHWEYCSIAGRAHVDWLKRCDDDTYRDQVDELRRDHDRGVMTLFGVDADLSGVAVPDRSQIESELKDAAVEYLVGRIPVLLSERGGSMRFVDEPMAVYGDWLGRAAEKHVRAAVKALFKSGTVDHNGTGKFWRVEIGLC